MILFIITLKLTSLAGKLALYLMAGKLHLGTKRMTVMFEKQHDPLVLQTQKLWLREIVEPVGSSDRLRMLVS